jgi:guanylate kinase
MGKIFYLMGKSASGKDTIYRILQQDFPSFQGVTIYTTRPIREGEQDGVEYHFVTMERCRELESSGKVIERRTYQTVAGPWDYFTVDDGEINLQEKSYLLLGTLESFRKIQAYYGEKSVYPLYIEVEDGVCLERAVFREKKEKTPNYREVCRRFLADAEDFSEEKLAEAGIHKRYQNDDLNQCLAALEQDIRTLMERE